MRERTGQERCTDLIARYHALKNARVNFDNLWQEVAELVFPNRADFTVTQSAGVKRTNKQFETTAAVCARMLAADINGMMTDPSAKWFGLTFRANASVSASLKEWLQQAEDILYAALYEPGANFQGAVNECYLDLPTIGTCALFTGWREKTNSLLFQSRSVSQIVIDENDVGAVDTVFRSFCFDARKIRAAFGENVLNDKMRADLEKNDFSKQWEIVQAVYPNEKADGNLEHAFKSEYILVDEKRPLKEEQFRELPFAVARWSKCNGEMYGRGPAIDCLADIKMLQAMMKETIIAAQLANRPPLLVQDDEEIAPMTTVPGGVIRYRGERPQYLAPGGSPAFGKDMMEDIRTRIRLSFMNGQLSFLTGDRRTATEIIERVREAARLMGPVYGRLTTELLSPTISRAFSLLYRAGVIPPAPAHSNDALGIDIVYLSPLAKAMRYEKADRYNQAYAASAAFLQADPSALALIDAKKGVREIHKIYGTEDVLRDEAEVEEILDRQNAQAQQQEQAQNAGTALELQAMQNDVRAQDKELGNV